MFSGIVEEYAEVVRLEKEQTNLHNSYRQKALTIKNQ